MFSGPKTLCQCITPGFSISGFFFFLSFFRRSSQVLLYSSKRKFLPQVHKNNVKKKTQQYQFLQQEANKKQIHRIQTKIKCEYQHTVRSTTSQKSNGRVKKNVKFKAEVLLTFICRVKTNRFLVSVPNVENKHFTPDLSTNSFSKFKFFVFDVITNRLRSSLYMISLLNV